MAGYFAGAAEDEGCWHDLVGCGFGDWCLAFALEGGCEFSTDYVRGERLLGGDRCSMAMALGEEFV